MSGQGAVVASKGTPWALLAVVALLIAKFGFGVPIGLLWVFAPIWIPIAAVLGIIAVCAVCYGLFVAVVFGFAAIGTFLRRRAQRRNANPYA